MKRLFLYFILLIIITEGCKEKYLPPIISQSASYLVVEGFINSGTDPTSIMLTRTTKLYNAADIIYEHNAVVNIEGENQETFPLYENGNGNYVSSASLNLNSAVKYRLHIMTIDGKEYASDFVPFKHTPEIDSISWQRENDGLKIYVNTHDAQNTTRYYQWKYEETWEIHSAYKSSIKYAYDADGNFIGLVYRIPSGLDDTTIYKCWQSHNSTNIILGSSEKLSADKIFLPLLSIEPKSEKLSVLYSIHLRQYALSKDAYVFFQKIKKNTEQIGSIFDAQPSELQGNIRCTNNPAEIVVGYVDISEEKEERIFISNSELPGWNYKADCPQRVVANYFVTDRTGLGLEPTEPNHTSSAGIDDFFASYVSCVDCTTKGTNQRPSFWP